MDYAELGQNDHWDVQNLGLGISLFGDLSGHPDWAAIPSGECKNQNGGGVLGWTRLQYSYAWEWTESRVHGTGLDSTAHWCL